MRTSDQTRPKTLLAAVNTFFTNMVILPPAVLAHSSRHFLLRLIGSHAPAHHGRASFPPGVCARHIPSRLSFRYEDSSFSLRQGLVLILLHQKFGYWGVGHTRLGFRRGLCYDSFHTTSISRQSQRRCFRHIDKFLRQQ